MDINSRIEALRARRASPPAGDVNARIEAIRARRRGKASPPGEDLGEAGAVDFRLESQAAPAPKPTAKQQTEALVGYYRQFVPDVTPAEAQSMYAARRELEKPGFMERAEAVEGVNQRELDALRSLRGNEQLERSRAETAAGESAGFAGRAAAATLGTVGGTLEQIPQSYRRLEDFGFLPPGTTTIEPGAGASLLGMKPGELADVEAVGAQADPITRGAAGLAGVPAMAADPIGAATLLSTGGLGSRIIAAVGKKGGGAAAQALARILGSTSEVGAMMGLDAAVRYPDWSTDPAGGVRMVEEAAGHGAVAGLAFGAAHVLPGAARGGAGMLREGMESARAGRIERGAAAMDDVNQAVRRGFLRAEREPVAGGEGAPGTESALRAGDAAPSAADLPATSHRPTFLRRRPDGKPVETAGRVNADDAGGAAGSGDSAVRPGGVPRGDQSGEAAAGGTGRGFLKSAAAEPAPETAKVKDQSLQEAEQVSLEAGHEAQPTTRPYSSTNPTSGKAFDADELRVRDRLAAAVADKESLQREYAKVPGSDGGRIIGTDLVRELDPEYVAEPGRFADATGEPAGRGAKALIEEAIEHPPTRRDLRPPALLITGGGAGSGKSTLIRGEAGKAYDLIIDNQLRDLPAAQRTIDRALEKGWDVQVAYVHRPFAEAVAGAVDRAAGKEGRGVSDIGRMHAQARATIRGLVERYQNEPRVRVRIVRNKAGGLEETTLQELERAGELTYESSDALRTQARAELDRIRASGKYDPAIFERFGPPRREAERGVGSPDEARAGELPRGRGAKPAEGGGAGEAEPAWAQGLSEKQLRQVARDVKANDRGKRDILIAAIKNKAKPENIAAAVARAGPDRIAHADQAPSPTGRPGEAGDAGGQGPVGVDEQGRRGKKAPRARRPAPPPPVAPERRARQGEFSKSDIERRLIDAHRSSGLAQEVELSEAERAESGQDVISTEFPGKLPGEVRDWIDKDPSRRRLFKANVPTGKGADILSALGDEEYFRRVEAMIGGKRGEVERALEHARMMGDNDPATHFLGFLHENLSERQAERAPYHVIDNPGELPDGATFKVNGTEFAVVHVDGEPLLVEQGDAGTHTTYARALESIPVDAGSLKIPETKKPEPPAAEPKHRPGQQMGLLGERYDGGITGSQKDLGFGERSALEEETRAKQSSGEDTETMPMFGPKRSFLRSGGGQASPAHTPAPAPGAKWTHSGVGRIPVDPTPGTRPKAISQIILDLGASVGKQVRTGKPGRGAGGTYYPGSTKTVIRFSNDLDITAHEVAHALDDRFGIVGPWAGNRVRSPFDKELIPHFSQYGSSTQSGPRSKLSYMRAEGVAEWMRAWMINPAAATKAAPQFAAHFESVVPKEVRDKVRSFGDDVRAWAGASNVERTVSNVEMSVARKKMVERVREAFTSNGVGSGFLAKMKAEAIDSLAPVWEGIALAKRLRGLGELLPESDPVTRMRLFAGEDKKIMDVLNHGPIDTKGARVKGVGGLDWLLEPLDASSPEAFRKDFESAVALGLSERVVEKADQIVREADKQATELEMRLLAAGVDPLKAIVKANRIRMRAAERAHRLSGAGGGVFSDLSTARQTIAELAADPKRMQRVKEAVGRYRTWADALLDYLHDSGRISKEQRDGIRGANNFYFAMKRLHDTMAGEMFGGKGGGRKLASIKQTIHRFSGSTRTIENPYISLVEQTYAMIREADRNAALRSFTNLLSSSRGMYQGKPLDFDQIGSRAKSGDPDTIKVYADGEEQLWQFAPEIHKALKGWNDTPESGALARAFMLPARVTRSFVTLFPGFIARQQIRDPVARAVVSRSGATPFGQLYFLTPDGMADYSKLASEFNRHGGGLFGHHGAVPREAYAKALREAIQKVTGEGNSIITFPAKLWDSYKRFAEQGEVVNRLAEYRTAYDKAKAKGYDDTNAAMYAALQARDLQDFSVAGSFVKKVNQFVPFTSAAVRGLARSVEAAAESPVKFAARWMTYVLSLELMHYGYHAAMGDEEEHRKLSPYRRDFFYNIRLGDWGWLTIPKPYELGVLGSMVSRGIDAARGKASPFKGAADSLAAATFPIGISDLAGPAKSFVELLANRDLYSGRELVPFWEQKKPVVARKGARQASPISRKASELLRGLWEVDPRYIDRFMESQFGTAGRTAQDLSRGEFTKAAMRATGLLAPTR